MPARRKKKSLFANEEKKGKGELVQKYMTCYRKKFRKQFTYINVSKGEWKKILLMKDNDGTQIILTGISSWNFWPWPWGLIYENIKNFLQVFHIHDKTSNLFIQWPWTIFCCILLSPAIYICILQHCQVQLLDISSQVSPWTV